MGELVKGRVSVIIPGRCEVYFQQTIDSALDRAAGDVEVVAVVDGYEPDPPLVARDERVKIVKLETSIGQRAGYNLGVRESTGEYVMKIDAHCLLSPGYDEVLKAHCPHATTVLPEMRRLDVHTWKDKPRGKTLFMFFGLDLYCHFWDEYGKRPEAQAEYPEVMTGQGSCWFCRRQWNDYIGLLDERVGSWGNVGIEVSLRTWLCGGTQIVNRKAWQAHWFRKDEGGFPYPLNGRDVGRAHAFTRDNYYYKDDAFEHQSRPFKWLIQKFAPVPGWEAYLADGFTSPRVIVYYTDSQLEPRLATAVRKNIAQVAGPIPIISVSQEPLRFGQNVCVGPKPREYRSMYEQLLAGLEAAPEDSIIYCVEHDVFYHPSHFAFTPPEDDHEHAYFNTNRYHWKLGVRSFLKARGKVALSQCVAHRDVLIRHCRERLALWDQGIPNRMSISHRLFESERPNVDIRHDHNLTPTGRYKWEWIKGRTKGVTNLPGWGGPRHFQSKTGYKAEPKPEAAPEPPAEQDAPVSQPERTIMTPAEANAYLRQKWARRMPQPSPVRCPGFRRKHLPALFREMGLVRGAEVGVREGVFSEALCRGIPDLDLLCVDLWDAYYHFGSAEGRRHYETAVARLAPYNARLVKATSMAGAALVEDGSLDFVYIDADHRFDYVMQDLIEWSKKVRPGGIVSGHDYYRFRNAGVVPAVDTYTHCHYIEEWYICDEKEASFFWVRPEDRDGT